MASPSSQVILFLLLDYSEPKFVGLSWYKDFQQTIAEHRATKPPFMVQVLGTFDNLHSAQAEARKLISRFHTKLFGWNKTEYGDLDYKEFTAKGIVGWQARYDIKKMPEFDITRARRAEQTRRVARENDHASRLPYHAGDTHPMKEEANREKLRNTSTGRRRYYKEDGSWTWQYAADHPLAYKNRDNGIPNLGDK